MSVRRWSAPALLFVMVCLASGSLRADAGEDFGLGPLSAGRGAGGVTLNNGGFAAAANPAALALPSDKQFTIGAQFGVVRLNRIRGMQVVEDRDRVLPEQSMAPGYLGIAGRNPIGRRLSLGWTLAVPWQGFYIFRSYDPYIPYAARWSNRSAAVTASVALGLELRDGIWLGAGIDVMPRAAIDLDLRLEGWNDGGEAEQPIAWLDMRELEIAVLPAVRPRAGVLIDFGAFSEKAAGWRLGFSWAEPIRVKLENVHINLRGTEIGQLNPLFNLASVTQVQATANLSITDFYRPRRLTLGLSRVTRRGSLFVEARFNHWSRAVPQWADVIEGQGDGGFLVEFEQADGERYAEIYPLALGRMLRDDAFRDTLSFRVGGEWRPLPKALPGPMRMLAPALRFGYGWDPAYVRPDPGPATILDGDHHLLTLGLGLSAYDPLGLLPEPFSFDLSVGYLRIAGLTIRKDFESWPEVPGHPLLVDRSRTRWTWRGGHAFTVTTALTVRY